MTKYSLGSMLRGWYIGPFEPSVLNTSDFELGIKSYAQGEREPRHVHRVATEVTCVLDGQVRMNELLLHEGDIVVLEPGESSDFEALTDARIAVAKMPAVAGDKFEC